MLTFALDFLAGVRAWFARCFPARTADPNVAVERLGDGSVVLGLDLPRGVRVGVEDLPPANASGKRVRFYVRDHHDVPEVRARLREAAARLAGAQEAP